MKATRSRPSWRKSTRLCFEQLEGRRLPVVAAFTLNLYEDIGGTPGELIAGDTVQVGDSFFVEIMARDLDPLYAGFRGVALNVAWDPDALAEVDAPFDPADPQSALVTPHFPLFRSGVLDQDAGTITNLSGYALLSSRVGRAIGNLAPERFSLLRFQALEPVAGSPILLSQGRSRIATVPVSSLRDEDIYFEPQTINVVASSALPGADAEALGEAAGTALVPALQSATDAGETDDAQKPAPTLQQPQIAIASSSAALGTVQFTSEVRSPDGTLHLTPLVRPARPDTSQFVEVVNSGTAPLTIYEVQINAPDVTVDVALTSDPSDDLVLQPGQAQRFHLRYAPRLPRGRSPATQSFDVADGVVILSNAANEAELRIALKGDSTFDTDLTCDGRVDRDDLAAMLPAFGRRAGQSGYAPFVDPNNDGRIDFRDLGTLNLQYGLTRSPAHLLAAATDALIESGQWQPRDYSAPLWKAPTLVTSGAGRKPTAILPLKPAPVQVLMSSDGQGR